MLEGQLLKLGPFASLCCGLITIAAFLVLYTWQSNLTAEAGKTSSWAKCSGTVNHTYKERDGSTYVSYEYEGNGKKHIKSRIYYDQLSAGAFVPAGASYHVGQKVPVLYNPAKTDESVLFSGASSNAVNFWVYGLGLFSEPHYSFAESRGLIRPRF